MCVFFRERGSGEESPGADLSSNNTPETGQFLLVMITAPVTPLRQVDQNSIPVHSTSNTPVSGQKSSKNNLETGQNNIPDHISSSTFTPGQN
jgi:hypothetical protein